MSDQRFTDLIRERLDELGIKWKPVRGAKHYMTNWVDACGRDVQATETFTWDGDPYYVTITSHVLTHDKDEALLLVDDGLANGFRWHDATKELPEFGKGDYLVTGVNGGLYLCPRFEGYDDDHVWFRDTRGNHHEPIKVKAWAEIPPYKEER